MAAEMKVPKYVSVATIRILLIGTFLISALISLAVAVQGEQRDARIATNTYNLCLYSNKAAASTNTVLEALEAGAGDNGVYTPAERAIRVERYKKAKVPLLACDHLALGQP